MRLTLQSKSILLKSCCKHEPEDFTFGSKIFIRVARHARVFYRQADKVSKNIASGRNIAGS